MNALDVAWHSSEQNVEPVWTGRWQKEQPEPPLEDVRGGDSAVVRSRMPDTRLDTEAGDKARHKSWWWEPNTRRNVTRPVTW